MTTPKPLGSFVFAAWLMSSSIGLSLGQDCTFDDVIGGTLYVITYEDQETGSVAYNISVSPPTSTLSMSCTDSGPKSPCSYLEISGHQLIHKNTFDIESEYFLYDVVDSGETLVYIFVNLPTITCRVSGGTMPGAVSASIRYQNVNEAASIPAHLNASVLELTPTGTVVLNQIEIIDPDVVLAWSFGDFNCMLFALDVPFSVSCITQYKNRYATAVATIKVDGLLDYDEHDEGPQSYEMILQVTDTTDASNVPISVNTSLHIDVIDLDDLNPAFTSSTYTATIAEGISSVLTVYPAIEAYDQDVDINESVVYSLQGDVGNHLMIDSSTAEITLVNAFDHEHSGDIYTVDVLATQAINTNRYASVPITINIADTNDNCPYFVTPIHEGFVSTYDLYVSTVNETLLFLQATDDDEVFRGSVILEQDGDIFALLHNPNISINNYEFYLKVLQPQHLYSGDLHSLAVHIIDKTQGKCQHSIEISVAVANRDILPGKCNGVIAGSVIAVLVVIFIAILICVYRCNHPKGNTSSDDEADYVKPDERKTTSNNKAYVSDTLQTDTAAPPVRADDVTLPRNYMTTISPVDNEVVYDHRSYMDMTPVSHVGNKGVSDPVYASLDEPKPRDNAYHSLGQGPHLPPYYQNI